MKLRKEETLLAGGRSSGAATIVSSELIFLFVYILHRENLHESVLFFTIVFNQNEKKLIIFEFWKIRLVAGFNHKSRFQCAKIVFYFMTFVNWVVYVYVLQYYDSTPAPENNLRKLNY